MQVELTTSRVASVDGEFKSQRRGDVIDVDRQEADRLFAAGHAKAVGEASRPKGTPQEPRTATKPTGRNAAKRK